MTAERGIDRGWRRSEIPIEKIPSELRRRGHSGGIVLGSTEMILADQCARVTGVSEYAGDGFFVRRNLRAGQVFGQERRRYSRAQRIPSREETGPARRAFGHRPEIREFHAVVHNRANIAERTACGENGLNDRS